MRRHLLAGPLLAAAYAITGKLALLLAVPPGYASPIFPPAGIAVAAVLISGHPTLPWVFLGSFLLNVWTGSTIAPLPTSIAAAIIIGLSSTLQAALGGAVLRRAVGYPTALDNGRDLSRFLLLSPVYCLTSATLSLSCLWAIGVVRWGDLPRSWVSWWIGDTLGVLMVLPLMLVAIGQPPDLWRRRTLPVALPMLLFFVLFVTIYVRVSQWEHDEVLVDFRRLSQEVVDKTVQGSKNRRFSSSSCSDHSPARRQFRGQISAILSAVCSGGFQQFRRSSGLPELIPRSAKPSRRHNRAICRGSGSTR